MPYQVANRTVYYIGEPECEKHCKLTTKTGGPLRFDEVITKYDSSNQFLDIDFKTEDSSIDLSKLDNTRNSEGKSPLEELGWDRIVVWKRLKDAVAMLNMECVFSLKEANDTETKSRFDIQQGTVGDCWFVSGLSQITNSKELIDFVVPEDNISNNDSGAYHFRFCKFGEWVDVVVDDYIPMAKITNGWTILGSNMRGEAGTLETWPVLAEKAYAKINQSYANIEGNRPAFALEDLTGGICDAVVFSDTNVDQAKLFDVLNKLQEFSFANFFTGKANEELAKLNLAAPHAYSLTGLTSLNGTPLVRLRNPIGWGEWNGSWSEDSEEWKSVSEEKRKELGLVKADDGEFWISLADAIRYFAQIDCCFWFPEAIKEQFEIRTYHSAWRVADKTTGGLYEPWNSPQFPVALNVGNENGLGALIMGLQVKAGLKDVLSFHSLRAFRIPEKYAQQQPPYGEDVFLDPESRDAADLSPKAFKSSTGLTGVLVDGFRARIGRAWNLPLGNYIVVPGMDSEMEFMLRIITQRAPGPEGDVITGFYQ